MENYFLRITCVNLNEYIEIFSELTKINNDEKNLYDNQKGNSEFIQCILEDLDSVNFERKKFALFSLFNLFIQNKTINFLFDQSIETAFDLHLIEFTAETNLLFELSKNLSYLISKLTDLNKDSLSFKKLLIIYLIKINLLIIFFILFFNSNNPDLKFIIKNSLDDLEENILKILKLSTSLKMMPNQLASVVLVVFEKILISEVSDEGNTCRKVEKKDKYLTKLNSEKFIQRDSPKLFYKFDKENKFIEKFYRRNILKREKSEYDRVSIMNVLKILLNSCNLIDPNFELDSNKESIGDYILLTILRKSDILMKKTNFSPDNINLEIENQNSNLILNEDNEFKLEDIFSFLSLEKSKIEILEIINRFSICTVIISFYFMIIKCLQEFDLIQFSYYGFLLCDFNGLLVFLKFLNQDIVKIQQIITDNNEKRKISLDFLEVLDLLVYVDLKLIHTICNKNEERIKLYLVSYNIPVILKRLLVIYAKNEKIRKWCLKLFKIQLRFLDKNWRTENNSVITNIYEYLKYSSIENNNFDNWLKYETKDQKSLPYQSSEYYSLDELKKIYNDFNQNNYLKYLNNIDESEKFLFNIDKSYYSLIFLKLWNSVTLNNEFKQNYENII